MVKVGVIGGSGLYELPGLADIREEVVDTPFGSPSDALIHGRLGDASLVFLPRHGRGHRFTPTEVPYRANLWALKQAGCSWVISVSAVGSLREEIAPGQVVLVDQFIDRTRQRPSTFFGDGVVGHISFGDPGCGVLRSLLRDSCASLSVPHHDGGTYVCMEGPAFSTRAESNLYRSWGASVIGMTNLPEAKLAREAELSYAIIAMVTDFDCWHPDHDAVEVAAILRVLRENATNAARLLARLLRDFPASHEPCPIGSDRALDYALITAPDVRDPDLLRKLEVVMARVNKTQS
jgi:5'-methylthioadenosine phosphorylase